MFLSVIIDGDKLIERQLKAISPEEVVVAEGIKTPITPIRYIPILNDFSLTGDKQQVSKIMMEN